MANTNPRRLAVITLLIASTLCIRVHSETRDRIGNVSVFRVNRVKAFEIATDKPVSEARLIIDGKEVAKDGWQAERTGFRVAIITPGLSPGRKGETEPDVHVHVQASSMGGLLTGPYRPARESNLQKSERLGPSTNVVLSGWTEVYGEKHTIGTNIVYEIKLEIR